MNEVKMIENDGLLAAQSVKVIDFLDDLKQFNFELAIEIGTCRGLFTSMIKSYIQCETHTFDIKKWKPWDKISALLEEYEIEFHNCDVFTSQKIVDLIKSDRHKIVFCDGGNKKDEFNRFSKYLNTGDFIALHDFFETREDYSDEIWTTCEVVSNDLDLIGLEKVEMETATNSAWGIYKKLPVEPVTLYSRVK